MLTRHDPLLGRNRHDQQYENTAQHQAPVNASHLYPEGLDRHYQQLPYRQGMFYNALAKP
jgi:hypothetical protein